MNLRKKLRTAIGSVIISLLLGGSLTLTLLDALGFATDYWAIAVSCAGTALICATATLGIWPMIFIFITAVSAGISIYYFKLPLYNEILSLIYAALSGGEIAPYFPIISCAMCILLTLAAFLLTRMRGGVYPALAMLFLTALGCWLFGHRLNIYYISPALVAIAMLFASSTREETSFNAAFPIALVSVAVAMLLIPHMGGISSSLQQFSHTLRTTIADYVMFSDSRTLYSIQSDGYQGQSGQLGGNANPSDFPIMRVETGEDLLLRGTIKREYTGRIWIDSSVNSRNLFISPLRRALRNQVFGLDLPADDVAVPDNIMHSVSADITFLSRGTSTIFTPHRLTHLNTDADMVTYFNSSGEVFITRTVRSGDSYSISALLPDTYAVGMNEYLSGLSRNSSYYISDSYMQLPSVISTDVYDLTYSVISGKNTPYERARAIEDYLKANYRYTLTPGATPDGADFVSYFLLDGKEGYCAYFASAMGVMARIAGIPSRYIEGYLVKADESGVTDVIGKDAHAWIELYFDGFGWMSFDPTPDADDLQSDVPPLPDNNDNTDNNPDGVPTAEPEITPEPDEAPTETPTDSLPDEIPNEPTQNPTDIPEPLPTDVPITPPEEPNNDDNNSNISLKWLLIILLLIIITALLLIICRLLASDPHRASRRFDANADKLMVYYRALLTVHEIQGQVPAGGESPAAYARRLIGENQAGDSFRQFTDDIMRARYAGADVTDAMCDNAAQAYKDASKSLSAKERMRWYRRRIIRGIGDLKQIP